MKQIFSDSRRLSGADLTIPEFRIYWPNIARRFPRASAVMSVRSGLRGNGRLLGLIVTEGSKTFACPNPGRPVGIQAFATVGKAADYLRKENA